MQCTRYEYDHFSLNLLSWSWCNGRNSVLSRLPLRSVLRFKAVSKQWLVLISSPLFQTAYLNCQLTLWHNLKHLDQTQHLIFWCLHAFIICSCLRCQSCRLFRWSWCMVALCDVHLTFRRDCSGHAVVLYSEAEITSRVGLEEISLAPNTFLIILILPFSSTRCSPNTFL